MPSVRNGNVDDQRNKIAVGEVITITCKKDFAFIKNSKDSVRLTCKSGQTYSLSETNEPLTTTVECREGESHVL